ncbi:hypothetical protein HWQ67_17170 [Candidatus Magnetobacterium casensis]|uniref:Uncharacterized protein n=2 Tax=Candidatus Magnetobacterium casense TaxID=1455061 RepID=A0ABS6S399_9BACT|nr:hypothetical protein [Candidatus Magnetobacterium casensis]
MSGGDGSKEKPDSLATIDMDWLRGALEEIPWPDCGKWLREHFPQAKGASIKTVVESLKPKELEQFVAEVQNRLEAKSK